MRGISLERLGYLDGKLARRDKHQGLRMCLSKVDFGQHRQGEGTRLARPRLRLPQYVGACQERGNRSCLNRGRGLVSDVTERLQHALVEA